MIEDTSYYWRKRLGLDSPADKELLLKLHSPLAVLRPIFFSVFASLSKSIFPIKISGRENLPDPPYIIASNHASAMDYAVLAHTMGKEQRDNLFPIATKLFYDNLFARFFMKIAANIIRIDSADDFFPALRSAAAVLRLQKIVCIYPEGARSESGELMPFRVGVGTLALEAEVPIVPVYVEGTLDVLPTGALMFRRGEINIVFGRIVDPKPYIEKKKHMQAYDVYKEITQELRKRILELANK